LGGLLELHENQKCAQNNWEDMEEKKRKATHWHFALLFPLYNKQHDIQEERKNL